MARFEPSPTTLAIRQDAYSKLGVSERDVVSGPQITPQLKIIAKTIQRAGQPHVTRRVSQVGGHGHATVEVAEDTHHAAPYSPGADLLTSWPTYLHATDDADARKVLLAYYDLPKYARDTLPIEAFCCAATVSPLRILELITGACVRMGAQASTIIAAVNHPRIVEKTVEMALTDEGTEDRATLHKHAGFIPVGGGAKTQINIQQNANSSASAQSVAVPPPPPEQTVRRLVERFHEARGLPAIDATPLALLETTEVAETALICPPALAGQQSPVPSRAELIDVGDGDDPDEAD